MLNFKKKSIWRAKGAKYENYNPQKERKESPPPQIVQPTASGPTHGTLPAGFKATETIKSPKLKANTPRLSTQHAASDPTHSAMHPPDKQFAGVPSSTTIVPQPELDIELRPENYEKVIFTQTFYAIKRLEQNESRHAKKLESIKQALEHGYPLSQRDLRYLKRRYEKFKQAIEYQDRIEWTMETIEKLLQSNIGDPEKIDAIKELLEDEVPLAENDREYIREAYKLLQRR